MSISSLEQSLYFIDAEFIEDGKRCTIDLISIAIVSNDGREYYACNDDCDLSKANDWVKTNVIPNLPSKGIGLNPGDPDVSPSVRQEILHWKTKDMIAQDILDFCNPKKYGNPVFWGEWSAYDWVVFCWIFGDMVDLPNGFPMRCRDVMQYAEDHLGISEEDLPQSLEVEGNHNALLGARSVKKKWLHCWDIEVRRGTQKDALYSAIVERCDKIIRLLPVSTSATAIAEVKQIKKDIGRTAYVQ